ncbi:hypothetical protein ABZV77_23645 [Streptomyces sp. NPDC004732]|uniref:hypothetical protein n=1 Tax=Streptomyces sp. NPDC004732 TaxID=3154290 RepID=UPI0033AC8AC9
MGSDPNVALDLIELIRNQSTLVVAPNGTVNTGTVNGDQRNVQSTLPLEGSSQVAPPRQGPVRAKDLQVSRRRFVRPHAFEAGLAALDSGVLLLVGEPGTGRRTLALNLLAHGHDAPSLGQVDGTVDLTRWRPRSQGADGYLVMDPGDPFALRPWDLSNLEELLAEAAARLVIVLPDAPGLVSSLESDLGAAVVRHQPPEPTDVFHAHFADLCPDGRERERLLEPLGPEFLPELLPAGLSPAHAAEAARTVARPGGIPGGRAEVLSCLAQAEAARLLVRAEGDPELLAQLFSVCVYGGLDRATVVDRAADLLTSAGPAPTEPDHPAQTFPNPVGHPGHGLGRPGSLRSIGAHAAPCEEGSGAGSVAFLWPAVSEAVWDAVCRDRADLLPLLHDWLGRAGADEEEIEHAGRAVAALGRRTGGRTFGLVRRLALSNRRSAVKIAALSLGTAVQDPVIGSRAGKVLLDWSQARDPALRTAVAYACRSDMGGAGPEFALSRLHRAVDARGEEAADAAVASIVAETLRQRFAAGDAAARTVIVRHLLTWARSEGVAGQTATLTFPALVACDTDWFADHLLARQDMASVVIELVWQALNEAASYPSMRDELLAWACWSKERQRPESSVEELFVHLVESRQHGVLRLLMSIERGGDTLPGKDLALRSLAVWHGNKQPGIHECSGG